MNFFILCFFDLSTVFCKIWVSCWFRHDGARVFSSGHLVQDLSGAFGEATIHGMFPTPLPAPDICPNNWIEAAVFQCVYTGRYGPFQHFPNSIYCSRVYFQYTGSTSMYLRQESHRQNTLVVHIIILHQQLYRTTSMPLHGAARVNRMCSWSTVVK